MNSDIVATPKRTVLGRKHVVWEVNYENQFTCSTWVRAPEKKYSISNQPGKKSQNRNISPIWGEAPAEWIEMKICTDVDLGDIIIDKFKSEISWILMSLGVKGQSSSFPIDFARGLYHSAALTVKSRCVFSYWLCFFMACNMSVCAIFLSYHCSISLYFSFAVSCQYAKNWPVLFLSLIQRAVCCWKYYWNYSELMKIFYTMAHAV